MLPELRLGLDGKNLELVLTEFGTRFHKLLLDHMYQYIFSDVGKIFICSEIDFRQTLMALLICITFMCLELAFSLNLHSEGFRVSCIGYKAFV